MSPDERSKKLIVLTFTVFQQNSRQLALEELCEQLRLSGTTWIRPEGSLKEQWRIDLDAAGRVISYMQQEAWARGVALVRPEIEEGAEGGYGIKRNFHVDVRFLISPEEIVSIHAQRLLPWDLQESVSALRRKHASMPFKAFVMMPFEVTPAHKRIIDSVRSICCECGVAALRADDYEYCPDILANIRTYMHGCDMGIAIFDRISRDDFNPNISLEVGYMLALGRPLCLLKDATLRSLPTDLVGRLYRTIDIQEPEKSVREALGRWLVEKGFAKPTG